MAPRGETRARLVQTTGRLLRRKGYHGTGLLEVLEESGAPRGSLYFHFPEGKSQLAAEALDEFGETVDGWLRRGLERTATVAEAVNLLFDRYAAGLERNGFDEGCAVAGVALDLPIDEAVVGACRQAVERWQATLAEALVREGRSKAEAVAVATTVIASLEGAMLMARIQNSVEPIRAASASLGALLSHPVAVTPAAL